MHISMNAQELLEGLLTVTRALAPRSAKQILEGVLMETNEEGITLTCSDGSLVIKSLILGDVKEPGRAVLPGRLFTELTRKLPGGEVSIKVGDNHAASIRCMSYKSNLSGMNAMEYPEMPESNKEMTVSIPQNKLKEMINRVVFSIATDESRQILTGCLLEVTRNEARLVALDGFRLAMQTVEMSFTLPDHMESFKAVIPGRVLNEMSKVLADEEETCDLYFDNNRMQAVFGNTVLNTVLLAGEYIDYRKILPASFKTMAVVNRNSVLNAIDRASLMAREGKTNTIRLSFTEGNLAISSNAEMGDVLEDMDAKLEGDPIDIAFNAKYITDVIRNTAEEELSMRFNSNVSPCIVTPTQGNDFLYLVLPVRVFQ